MKLLRPVFAVFAVALTLALAACGSNDITAPDVEAAAALGGQGMGSGY